MTLKERPVPISNVVAETPEWAQGDTTASPKPAPSDNKTRVSAREAIAPAATAAHETPAIAGSKTSSVTPTGRIVCSIVFSRRVDFDTSKCWNLLEVPSRNWFRWTEPLSCFNVLLRLIHKGGLHEHQDPCRPDRGRGALVSLGGECAKRRRCGRDHRCRYRDRCRRPGRRCCRRRHRCYCRRHRRRFPSSLSELRGGTPRSLVSLPA